MNKEDKKAIECVKLLKEYCEKRENCAGKENDCSCIFLDKNERNRICTLRRCPNTWKSPSLKPKLYEDEKAILRNIDEKYKWIARDEDGKVYAYDDEPKKDGKCWNNRNGTAISLRMFKHLFDWCTWEDDEPWYIPDLLKE